MPIFVMVNTVKVYDNQLEFQLIMVLKKPSYPIWTFIFIFMVSLFFLGFYLNGKFALNYTWNDDWGKVLGIIFIFFYVSMNVGYEWHKIISYAKLTKDISTDKNHHLYEYLQGYLAEYNMSEKPRLDFLKRALLIRLVHLNTNKPKSIVTIELCKNISEDEKERTIQLNMLIDHWIEEFINGHNENIRKINEKNNFKDRIEEINISDDMQFHVISFLLTNVCHETISVEAGHRIKN